MMALPPLSALRATLASFFRLAKGSDRRALLVEYEFVIIVQLASAQMH